MTDVDELGNTDSAICPACDEPNGKHCKDCWRCPGDRHDPMCGF